MKHKDSMSNVSCRFENQTLDFLPSLFSDDRLTLKKRFAEYLHFIEYRLMKVDFSGYFGVGVNLVCISFSYYF